MATRSRIGIEDKDGSVRSVYCHWDGYPSNNGKILNTHYTDRAKVEALIALGSISSLQENVEIPEGVEHTFENQHPGITVAYHRDRGEDLSIENHYNKESFMKGDVEEYGYLFTQDGKWKFINGHVSPMGRCLAELSETLLNHVD